MNTFSNRTLVLNDGTERPYALFVPAAYADDNHRHWPLVLFMHGIGERGDDGVAPTRVGIGPTIRSHPDRFDCLVALPQCPPDGRWTENLALVDSTWKAVARDWRIDAQNIVVTGVSMGGFGAWAYGALRGPQLAALVPVCGGGRVDRASRLSGVPIWAFHGMRDAVIDAQQSRDMVRAVRAAGGDVRYTEYSDEGHDCWDRVFDDAAVIRWMLGQPRQPLR